MSIAGSDDHNVGLSPPGPAGTSESALPPDTTVREFRILRLIGEGGFGIVYLAHDESLDRTVALKEYMPSELAERTFGTLNIQVRSQRYAETFDMGMRSFINEAKLLARFDHPSLLKVYRFFQDNGTAYMAMPFYEGQTLKAVLRTLTGPPDETWLRRLLYQLLDALEVMHTNGCYHRDIAPDNILLQNDVPILLDFGAARQVIGDMTQALTVILKPGYAPIEQYAEDPQMKQGAWTDIYALAGVVHFALTGRPPPAAVARAMNDQLVPLAQRMGGVYSDGFLKTIDAALSVRPQERPQSVAELRARLRASDEDKVAARAPAAPVLSIEAVPAVPAEVTSDRKPSSPPPERAVEPVVTVPDDSVIASVRSPRPAAAAASSSRVMIAALVLAVPAALAAVWWWTTSRIAEAPSQAQAPAAQEPASVPPPAEPTRVSPAPAEPIARAPAAPPVAVATPVEHAPAAAPAASKAAPPAPPPARADAAKGKAPEPPKAVAATPAKAAPVAPSARVEPANPPSAAKAAPQPAPRTEEVAEAPKPPPQQVARVEPKAEPPAKAEAPRPPVEVARVEPKPVAPAPPRTALSGRYTGSLTADGAAVGVTLTILSVQDGSVSATTNYSTGRCEGDYRMTGTVLNDSLRLRSTHSGGRYGDCSIGFRATVQGTKLVGQTSTGTPLELSR